MNGYNTKMGGKRTQHRPTFAFNPSLALPDTVGMCKNL